MSQSDSSLQRAAVAGDIMSTPVVFVRPDATVQDTAALLLERGISAVPVVDESGPVIGIVSEGDLLGRNEKERLAGRDWWLDLMANGGQIELMTLSKAARRPVRDVMHAPVVTVEMGTPVRQVADMLRSCRVKRLPVLENNKLVGIVTRADLLRIVADMPAPEPPHSNPTGGLAGFITGLIGGSGRQAGHLPKAGGPTQPRPAPFSADLFRELVTQSKQTVADEHRRVEAEAELARGQQVKKMLQEHIDDETWHKTLELARNAAQQGTPDFQVMSFPSELCSDGGRRIDIRDDAWPETLRGEAADFYLRWERELKPLGFGLQARIVDYPQGKLGDIGLFLTWGG